MNFFQLELISFQPQTISNSINWRTSPAFNLFKMVKLRNVNSTSGKIALEIAIPKKKLKNLC